MVISPAVLYAAIQEDVKSYLDSEDASCLDDFNYSNLTQPRVRSVAIDRLASSIVKKFEPVEKDTARSDKAIALFLESNERCRSFKLDTSNPLIAEMRLRAFRELKQLDWDSLLSDLSVGSGASVQSQGMNSSFEKFFTNRLTTTSVELYKEYHRILSASPIWGLAEEYRLVRLQKGAVVVVNGSSLSTVPKNSDIDRTIATEPSLNMMFQKALGEQINRSLKVHYGYSKALQPERNRRMACKGSLDGSYCTIDLSSASDTISMNLIEAVLPADWVSAIKDCRSPVTRIDGQDVELYMVSSMGNGFTFQLMTYIFSLMLRCIAIRANRPFEPYNLERGFGVFGDDIIVPHDIYSETINALIELGFIPNEDKSFSMGYFRESCGGDFYKGRNVRGVYCKRLRTLQDRYSLINRLNRWSAIHGVPLVKTIQLLLPSRWTGDPVPLNESDTAGIKVPVWLLHRPKPWYFAWTPKRKVLRLLDRHGNLNKHGLRNPFGYLLSAVAGWVDNGCIDRKVDHPRYSRVKRLTANWASEADLREYGVALSDWEIYTYVNLTGLA